MLIAIDIKSTLKEKITGIGSYTLRLIKALSKPPHPESPALQSGDSSPHQKFWCGGDKGEDKVSSTSKAPFFRTGCGGKVDGQNQYLLFSHFSLFNTKKKFPLSHLPDNFHLKGKRLSGKIIFPLLNKIKLPLDYFLGQVDIFQTTEAKYPHPQKAKLIHFLADVIPLVCPEFYAPKEVSIFRRMLSELLDKTDGIIVPSLSTQKDILRFFPDLAKPIEIIPIGVEEEFRRLESFPFELLRQKYGLSKKVILSVGTLEARKNFSVLLEAFQMLKQKGLNYQLVISGDKIEGWEKLLALSRSLNLSQEVIFTGYISQEELIYFYNLAELFVYPSLYEGYGLPPLEALACGLPVIVSRRGALAEVVGEAGLFFEPSQVRDLYSQMELGLTSSTLRESLIDKGFRRVKELSLENMARKTVAFYEKILGSKPR